MTEQLCVDIKRLQDGRWLICNPRTGHIYYALPAGTSEDDVLRSAADTERTGWLPLKRGLPSRFTSTREPL